MKRTTEDRFMEKVNKTADCWEWTGAVGSSRGYGNFWDGARYTNAHRWAYVHMVGDPGDLMVLHRCDNRLCVNPAHLFLGTAMDNTQDMVRKDRHVRGERQGRSKLTSREVLAIRSDPAPSNVVATRYGISARYARAIRSRVTWRHI
jgi:hypothetical protein